MGEGEEGVQSGCLGQGKGQRCEVMWEEQNDPGTSLPSPGPEAAPSSPQSHSDLIFVKPPCPPISHRKQRPPGRVPLHLPHRGFFDLRPSCPSGPLQTHLGLTPPRASLALPLAFTALLSWRKRALGFPYVISVSSGEGDPALPACFCVLPVSLFLLPSPKSSCLPFKSVPHAMG